MGFMGHFEPNMGQNMGFMGNMGKMGNICSVGSMYNLSLTGLMSL